MKWKFLIAAAALVGAMAANTADAQYRRAQPYVQPWDDRTASAAHLLSEQARHFAAVLRSVEGYSHLTDDAHALADSAEHLHEVVEGYDGPRHVQGDFRAVAHDFRHLREQLDRAHRAHHVYHLQDDWRRLTQSYVTVSHLLDVDRYGTGHGYDQYGDHGSYDDRSYGHGSYQDDRRTYDRRYQRGRVYRDRTYRGTVRVRPAPRGGYYRYQYRY